MSFRVIVKSGDDYVNIPATKMERDDAVVFVYYENELAGMFSLGSIDMIYRSGGDR